MHLLLTTTDDLAAVSALLYEAPFSAPEEWAALGRTATSGDVVIELAPHPGSNASAISLAVDAQTMPEPYGIDLRLRTPIRTSLSELEEVFGPCGVRQVAALDAFGPEAPWLFKFEGERGPWQQVVWVTAVEQGDALLVTAVRLIRLPAG